MSDLFLKVNELEIPIIGGSIAESGGELSVKTDGNISFNDLVEGLRTINTSIEILQPDKESLVNIYSQYTVLKSITTDMVDGCKTIVFAEKDLNARIAELEQLLADMRGKESK